jgi:hypothetical protein
LSQMAMTPMLDIVYADRDDAAAVVFDMIQP